MKRVMSPILILSILLSCGSGVTGDPLPDNPEVPDVKTTYRNPVVNFSLPDPTIIQAADSSFYLYATEDIRNVPILHSSDLVNWTEVGTAFTDQTRPNFEPKGGFGLRILIVSEINMYCITQCLSGVASGLAVLVLLPRISQKDLFRIMECCSEVMK